MSLTLYQNAVVGVQAQADAADFELSSTDKLYYHFDCHDAPTTVTNAIFQTASYKYLSNRQDVASVTSEGDMQGGSIHRYAHNAGSPNFGNENLLPQMQHLVNFYMMNNATVAAAGNLDSASDARYATANAAPDNAKALSICATCEQGTAGDKVAVTSVIDEAEADGNFLLSGATWGSMLVDTAGRFTVTQMNLIFDHLGTAGRLKTGSGLGAKAFISQNLRNPANDSAAAKTIVKISITYEAHITVVDEYNNTVAAAQPYTNPPNSGMADSSGDYDPNVGLSTLHIPEGAAPTAVTAGEESYRFPAKKFAFTKGQNVNGAAIDAAGTVVDASNQTPAGKDGCLRFRKTYIMEQA